MNINKSIKKENITLKLDSCFFIEKIKDKFIEIKNKSYF
jgi:hypothetical protein